jgi:hypothetical protein
MGKDTFCQVFQTLQVIQIQPLQHDPLQTSFSKLI